MMTTETEQLAVHLQRLAHLLRLEGDYVSAQETERQLARLNAPPSLPIHTHPVQEKSAA